ncbi:MAG: prepilin-type N-terminal cleavage/methylation domain-containing protein [Eubacteriaceae bacterium]|jgi:prepilin-type N-terminal cleavage/methylation domain-containing protein|nr:prepilin-type N-terminal cleavage/methylation domain-containing protein [Eubacteriaceae bacterium]
MADKLKNLKKGFTLIEITTVLVILTILAALLFPVYIGYINKVKGRISMLECRNCILAAQTIASESYNSHVPVMTGFTSAGLSREITDLAEADGTVTFIGISNNYAVTELRYISGDHYITEYRGGKFTTEKQSFFNSGDPDRTVSDIYAVLPAAVDSALKEAENETVTTGADGGIYLTDRIKLANGTETTYLKVMADASGEAFSVVRKAADIRGLTVYFNKNDPSSSDFTGISAVVYRKKDAVTGPGAYVVTYADGNSYEVGNEADITAAEYVHSEDFLTNYKAAHPDGSVIVH